MKPALRRDSALAAGSLVTLVGLAIITGRVRVIVSPLPILIGIVGALLLEGVFLHYPERTRAVWERPGVQALGVGLVIIIGLFGIRAGLDWMVATLAGGLVAYLGIITVVAVGYNNPVEMLIKRR